MKTLLELRAAVVRHAVQESLRLKAENQHSHCPVCNHFCKGTLAENKQEIDFDCSCGHRWFEKR